MIDDSIIKQVDDNGLYSVGNQYYVNAHHWNNDKTFKDNVNTLFKLMLKGYSNYNNIRVVEDRTGKSYLSTICYLNRDHIRAYEITFV